MSDILEGKDDAAKDIDLIALPPVNELNETADILITNETEPVHAEDTNTNETEHVHAEDANTNEETTIGQLNKETVPEEHSSKRLEVIMDTLNGKEEIVTYSSDEFEQDSELSESEDDSSTATNSSSSEDDDHDNDGLSDENADVVETADLNYDDDLEDEQTGPIRSKNEVVDETAPVLPEDFKIDEKAPLELIGEVISAVEKSVIIKATISGEFRILKENSILCFEDRQLLGPLFEVFGRLQSPLYRVKFNLDSDLQKFKDKIGANVYYVVPDSQFVYTDSIKAIKGTDASNWNDEEIPEEEQEFSDDEKEAASKSKKKRGKKKNAKANPNDAKRSIEGANSGPARKIAKYTPIYSESNSISDTDSTFQKSSAPLPQSVPRIIPPKPAEDPQAQMLKLQQQFLQIHNSNNMKRNNRSVNESQHSLDNFGTIPDTRYLPHGQSSMPQPQVSYYQQNSPYPHASVVPNYQPHQQGNQPPIPPYNYMLPNYAPQPLQSIPFQQQSPYPPSAGYQNLGFYQQGTPYPQQPVYFQQNAPQLLQPSSYVQPPFQQPPQNPYPKNDNSQCSNSRTNNNNNDDVYDY